MHTCLDFLPEPSCRRQWDKGRKRAQPHWKHLSPIRNNWRARSIYFAISALYIIFFSNRLCVVFPSIPVSWSLSCKSYSPASMFLLMLLSFSCTRYLFSLLSFHLLFLFACSRILWRIFTDFYKFRLDLSCCYCVHKSDFIQFSSSKNLNNSYFV